MLRHIKWPLNAAQRLGKRKVALANFGTFVHVKREINRTLKVARGRKFLLTLQLLIHRILSKRIYCTVDLLFLFKLLNMNDRHKMTIMRLS